jgi:hypothetical protein
MANTTLGGSSEPLPRAQDIIQAIEQAAGAGGPAATPSRPIASEADADVLRQRSYAHLAGLQRHYRHKSQWSYFLMAMMFGMLAFQSFLLWKVGTGAWTFAQYDWLLPGLLIQNLAQIAGLCVIVVKALFKDMA